MSIVVRDVREHELDSVLALNNAAGPAILPLDAAKLRSFFDSAEYFRVAERDGNLAGFLVGFGSGSDHDSSTRRAILSLPTASNPARSAVISA